ncbi:hypothetical protein LP414_15600 [Polaromonas sp. P1(28)-13]|nr:hypothetical protein LP414_15600 [Polaromonas sp. P1(28)-13]
MAPTLSTSCDALPPEGVLLAGGGPALRTREVVVYCVYGHNVSADAVATLRAAGWNARWRVA